MSKNLQHFVDNFLRGLEVGNRMQDRWANQQYRREALDVARAKNAQAAEQFRQKYALDTRRMSAYEKDVEGRYIKNTTPKAGKPGKPALTPQQQAWYGASGDLSDPTTQSAAPTIINNVEADDNAATPEPPAFARGGPVRRPAQPVPSGGTGTNGPGSGYGDRAAPPPMAFRPTAPATKGYQQGGRINKEEQRRADRLDYETYRVDKSVRDAEGAQFMDDVRSGPPYTSRGFAMGHNEGRIERAPPKFADGGPVEPDGVLPLTKWDRDRIAFERGRQSVLQDDGREEGWARAEGSSGRAIPRDPGETGGQPTPPRAPIGGAQFGGARFGGNRFGGQTFGQSHGMNLPRDRDAPMPAFRNPSDPINRTVDEMPGWLRQDWQGEEDRADETQPAPPRDPGETGGFPEMQPADRTVARYKMIEPRTAPASGGGARGGGRGGAINTGWKPLRDQTRTAAYDPEKDLYDPDNVHATATPLQGAATYADRVFHQGQGQVQGQTSGEGAPTNSLSERGKAALYSGTGAADPKMMQQVFQTVDPQGTMPMEQKLTAAVKAVHDFYMKTGDTENANKSAFEIAQFGNAQAREHGKQALQLMQGGNMQGATDALIKGYNWLPDGKTASAENGQVVIKDEGGQTVAAYPLDPKAMQNIALGMASGQLGWDVIRMGSTAPPGAGAQPAASPPAQAQVAAQPAAAPAGPSQTPAAPATVTTPSRPSPPAAAPGAAVSVPPARTPAAPAPTAGPQTAKPAGETKPPASPPAQGAIDTKTTPMTTKTAKEVEQERLNKDPFGAPDGPPTRLTPQTRPMVTDNDARSAIARAQEENEKEIREHSARGRAIGIPPKDIAKEEARRRKEFADKRKEVLDRLRHDQTQQDKVDSEERNTRLRPRDIPEGGQAQFDTTMSEQINALKNEANNTLRSAGPEALAKDQLARDHAASVLRWANNPRDLEVFKRIATGIWRYNRHNNTTDTGAVNDANLLTSIVLPRPNGEKGVGANRQTGANATTFMRVADDLNGNVVLQLGDRKIHLDPDTYKDLLRLRANNWVQYEKEQADKGKSDKTDEKAKQAIKTLLPNLGTIKPSLTLPGLGAVGAARGN